MGARLFTLLRGALLGTAAWLAWIALCGLSMDQHAQRTDQLIPDASTWRLSVIIPALNEERCLGEALTWLRANLEGGERLEVIVVDGNSTDSTVSVARKAGATRVISAAVRGRAAQMNAGAAAATGNVLVFLHADTLPPADLVRVVRQHLAAPRNVLLGFTPLIQGMGGQPLHFMSAHNAHKTWLYPLLLQPLSYLSGLRLLFGDQVLCCRQCDFAAVGGFNPSLPIMEDADLCVRLARAGPCKQLPGSWGWKGQGRVQQLPQVAVTSGRRLQSWGSIYATYVHFRIAIAWYRGATGPQLKQLYTRLYTDDYR